MATVVNLTIDQGADYKATLTISDSTGALINLTGYTFRSKAKLSLNDTTEAFSFVFTLLNQTTKTGQVEMSLADTVSTALVIIGDTNYFYDVEMVDGAGLVTRIFQGQVKMLKEVTT